jgi:hypothetical protein
VHLRRLLASNEDLAGKLSALERKCDTQFKAVLSRKPRNGGEYLRNVGILAGKDAGAPGKARQDLWGVWVWTTPRLAGHTFHSTGAQ